MILRLLTVAALCLLSACAHSGSQVRSATIDWPARVGQVVPGMVRAEVDRFLPAWAGPAGALLSPPRVTTITGAGSAECYLVAPNWRVTVIYDDAGGERSGQNRLRKPATIERIRDGADS
jgi:hypothetical protein